MSYTVNTFDAFLYYVHKHMEWVKEETVSDCKEAWKEALLHHGFKEEYVIAQTPVILKQFGIHCEDIVMTRDNFAYILWRHGKEYAFDVYGKLKEVIEEYDVLVHGSHEGYRDYIFYKLYPASSNDYYGVEVAIDKPILDKAEYVVHINYIGRHHGKGRKKLKKYRLNKGLIDERFTVYYE